MTQKKKFRCIKAFALDRIDDDGRLIPGNPIVIEEGAIFTESDQPLFAAIRPAVRLDNEDGLWIEIHPDTLSLRFEEVST